MLRSIPLSPSPSSSTFVAQLTLTRDNLYYKRRSVPDPKIRKRARRKGKPLPDKDEEGWLLGIKYERRSDDTFDRYPELKTNEENATSGDDPKGIIVYRNSREYIVYIIRK